MNLTTCQPGWRAVFKHSDGYTVEPIACWVVTPTASHPYYEVRPICAMGGDVRDATEASNYLGVVGPGIDPRTLFDK